MLTLQQTFNKAAVHLLKQNAKALSDDGSACMYRAPDGKMCAVGALIDDQVYSTELEAHPVRRRVVREALALSDVPLDDRALILLSQLQEVHDYVPVFKWKDNLREIAHIHDLNTDAIDAV